VDAPDVVVYTLFGLNFGAVASLIRILITTLIVLLTVRIPLLAESKSEDAIPPGDLLGLSLTIRDFYGKAEKPVVVLQGIEYLTTINGFAPILRLIQGLSEENAERRGILLLPVAPESLEKRDEALLSAETTPLPKASDS
jgi:hypothetical protein